MRAGTIATLVYYGMSGAMKCKYNPSVTRSTLHICTRTDKSVQFVESGVHRAAICLPHDHGPRLFPAPLTPSQLGVLRPELQAPRRHQVTMLHHCYRFASVRDLCRRRDGPGKWRSGQSVSRTCCGGFRVKVG